MNHEIKVATNIATGQKTYFVDGRKKPREYVQFLERLAERTECMFTRATNTTYQHFKTLRG